MTSLRKGFKTDLEAANNGIIVELAGNPNEDAVVETGDFGEETVKVPATIPRFRLAKYSVQNKEFTKVVRKIHDNALKKFGVISIDKLSPEQSREMNIDIFIESVLKGWENFQPDSDGVNLEFSKDNARKIFYDEQWLELFNYLEKESVSKKNFSKELAEAAAKN